MTDTIPLRHAHFEGDWMEYFYDGELPVRNQIIEVPVDRPEWMRRSYILGFRQTPEGEWIEDLDTYVSQVQKARDAKETDASEGADVGGQSDSEDGLRASESQGSGSVSKRRVVRRRSNRSGSRA